MMNQINLELTLSAVQHINYIKKKKGDGFFLRIKVSTGGCKGLQVGFEFDDKYGDLEDLCINENEAILIAIDKDSYEYIAGSKINYVQDLGHEYFKLINPNASSTCGCGTSFDPGLEL
jgi:iron-sulfur cluster assembly accessory protein